MKQFEDYIMSKVDNGLRELKAMVDEVKAQPKPLRNRSYENKRSEVR